MLIVPLKAVPNQAVTIVLGGQTCQIDVYAKLYGLFLDLYVSNALVVAGAICEDRNRVVRSAYLRFVGDLMFVDQEGRSNPTYDKVGTRFLLVYLEAGDLSARR